MNKAIDVFLRDMKTAILEVAADDTAINKPCNIEDAIIEKSYRIAQCPFCGCDPELSIFSNGFEIACRHCRARGSFMSDHCGIVKADFEKFAPIVEPKICEDIPIDDDMSFNVLRLTLAAIAAWWAITLWNRRVD